MSGRTPARLHCGLALAALLAAACACGGAPPQPAAAPPQVVVAPVRERVVALSEQFVARTESAQTVEIRAQVRGLLERIAFEEGAQVRPGELLFAIDARSYRAAVRAARAAVAEAQAAARQAQRDVERYQPLARERAIPLEQLESARAQAERAQASVAAARARLAQAELELEWTRIEAPIRGRIGPSRVKTGSLVEPGSTLLDTIYGIEPIHVYFSLSERHYLELRAQRGAGEGLPELPVELFLADGSAYPHTGELEMLEPQLDVGTGTLRARARFANPDALLRPGMFARVRLALRVLQGALVIPQRAVQELQGRESVWVVDADDSAEPRQIATAQRLGQSEVIVASGLQAGERVVVEGAQRLRPGVRVQPRELAAEAAAYSAVARHPLES